jgi:RimJ/RimL family protein N-acetyltransferase
VTWYPIETERLLIRPYRESDYDALLKMQSREDVTRYLLYGPKSPAEVRESLALRMALQPLDTDGQAVTLAVELRATGQHLGDITLFMVSTEHRKGEIGFVFHPDFQGQGYAAEAARAVLAAGFERLGMHRIEGRCDARNTASAALLKRLGLRQEAHFVRNEFLKGEWTDELVFAVLEDEWQESDHSR